MIDTDKYENMRQLFLDFIDIGEDEPQWKRNLEIYDDLLAEVKRLQTIMHEIEAHNGVSAEVVAASSDALFMNDLLTEVKRLRETLATIKEDIDGYVSGKGWDGNIEGWQCISDSIAALGIESESEEE